MAKKEPKQWITVNGQHIPMYEGETKDQVVNRYIAKNNENVKQKQIAQNKAQADKLNGKTTDKEKKPYMTEDEIKNSPVHGKSMSESEKKRAIAELTKIAEGQKALTKVRTKNRIRMIEEGWEGTPSEYYALQKEQREKAWVEEQERKRKLEAEKKAKEEAKRKQLEEELKTQPKDKVEQYKIIQKTNPMQDDYHVGIRKPSDIKTWKEVLDEDKGNGESFAWGDFSRKDAEKAMQTGKITIYSSYPIKDGVFVSTSKVQAEEYAGGQGNRVYSKTVPLKDVAWINGDEGQFAKLKG